MMLRMLLVLIMSCLLINPVFPGHEIQGSQPIQFGVHTIRADDTVLRLARSAGFAWIIQLLEWREVAPTPDRRFWEYSDLLVQACEYYDLNLALRLDHPPEWAQLSAADGLPVDLDAYTRFVREVVSRYRGRVQAYIIWNEPNLSTEWNGQLPNPAGYVTMLKATYRVIKEIDSECFVISAGLAPTNERSEHALDDRLYLQQMYDHGFEKYMDALGAHPYGFAYPPDDPPGMHNSLNFARLQELREIMVRNGDTGHPIWATEIGWITEPAPESKIWQQVTSQQRKEYLIGAFEIARHNWPWLQLMAVWNLSNTSDHPDITGYSIIDEGYQPKSAYQGLAAMSKPLQKYRPQTTGSSDNLQIIAPDVVVHLGDGLHVNPGWSQLYCKIAPCRKWTGHFYIPSSGSIGGLGSTKNPAEIILRMEVMQVEEQGNLVLINGHSLRPQAVPVRAKPDFVTAWTTAEMTVNPEILLEGLNTIEVLASPRLAPYQIGVRFESIQVRNIRLVTNRTTP